MEQAFVVGLIGLTSLGAYLVGTRRLGLPARSLGRATRRMLEGIGFILIFLALNVALGTAIILTMRALAGPFVPVYVMTDLVWVGLAVLQGLTFQWWRTAA